MTLIPSAPESAPFLARLDAPKEIPGYIAALYLHPETIDMLRRDHSSRITFTAEMTMWEYVVLARLPTGNQTLDPNRPDHRVLMTPTSRMFDYPGELVVDGDAFTDRELWRLRRHLALLGLVDAIEMKRREDRGYRLKRRLAHLR